ncbi:MAG: ankyrin repeat domain-containing protein [Pseudomonadales bacterium]|nr:ankyrin repeat domain-containing protein [Pseudomonadales bacterium]
MFGLRLPAFVTCLGVTRLGVTSLGVTCLGLALSFGTSSAQAIEPPSPELPLTAAVAWRGADDSTALHYAVYEQDAARVAALLGAGAKANAVNRYGSSPMQLAAEVADTTILKLLLDAGADVESANPEGQSALMLVARTGNVAAAELLVAHGAQVNAHEQWGEQTALMWAAARRQPQMMAFLISHGADLNAQSLARDYRRHLTKEGRAKSLDSGGFTPLLYAVRENCAACVATLVQNHADLDQPDPDGVSPLLLAVLDARWDIAKQLIDAGADIQQWDIFGQTALFAASANRNARGLAPNQPLNQNEGLTIVRLLLERGANPDMQLFLRPAKQRGAGFSRGTTPLIAAAGNGDVEVIKLLLEHGAQANLPQADLQTPVSTLAGARGAQDKLVEALQLLHSAGADLDVVAVAHHLQRTRGGAPLHYAVRANNDKMVAALVTLGANINIKDHDGLTALDYAMARGYVPFLQMRGQPNTKLTEQLRRLGATVELDTTPFWPNMGPPFYYPWSIFPLDPATEARALVPGSFDHQ